MKAQRGFLLSVVPTIDQTETSLIMPQDLPCFLVTKRLDLDGPLIFIHHLIPGDARSQKVLPIIKRVSSDNCNVPGDCVGERRSLIEVGRQSLSGRLDPLTPAWTVTVSPSIVVISTSCRSLMMVISMPLAGSDQTLAQPSGYTEGLVASKTTLPASTPHYQQTAFDRLCGSLSLAVSRLCGETREDGLDPPTPAGSGETLDAEDLS